MRSGEVVAHLPTLIEEVEAPGYLPALIAAKAAAEHTPAPATGARPADDVARLHAALDEARAATGLPDQPTGVADLDELVVEARIAAG